MIIKLKKSEQKPGLSPVSGTVNYWCWRWESRGSWPTNTGFQQTMRRQKVLKIFVQQKKSHQHQIGTYVWVGMNYIKWKQGWFKMHQSVSELCWQYGAGLELTSDHMWHPHCDCDTHWNKIFPNPEHSQTIWRDKKYYVCGERQGPCTNIFAELNNFQGPVSGVVWWTCSRLCSTISALSPAPGSQRSDQFLCRVLSQSQGLYHWSQVGACLSPPHTHLTVIRFFHFRLLIILALATLISQTDETDPIFLPL